MIQSVCFAVVTLAIVSAPLFAQIGDPQLRTDHPWYPGELAMSTFARLFETQSAQYEFATGIKPTTEHDKALAAWFFRNMHFAHGEEGKEDLWGKGFSNDIANSTRDYWTGVDRMVQGNGPCWITTCPQ